MFLFSALLLLSAVSRWQVYEYWSGRVFWVPLSVLPSLWTVKETSIERKRCCIFLGISGACQWKIWCLWTVGCYNPSFMCYVVLELLCGIRFPVVCLLSLLVWWHSDGDLQQGLFCHHLFPLFTSDTFNHFISCHYLHDKCLYFLLHENERHNIKE